MTLSVAPSQALLAYRSVSATPAETGQAGDAGGGDFGAMVSNALGSAVAAGRQADAQAMQAVTGQGDLTQVVTAVSRAQLALETTVAVRDRVLQAYQDIIKMPI